MKIKPEVSSQNGTYTYGTPATTVPVVETTQAETSVTIKDGMTIIIGGLIKDQRIKTVNKIPLLGDIPMFGALFSKTDDQVVKQELVIFLTPHIITGEADYIKSPLSPPVGESLFTSPEKPAFERRRPVKLNPTIFAKDKDAWFRNEHTAAGDSGSQDAFAANAVSSFGTDDEYYYAVKRKIVDRIKLPKVAKGPANNVKVEFTLSPAGKITRGPDVLQSSNRKLDDACRNAVRRAAPYPAFPQSFGTAEKRFVIDIVAEK
jgi:hypothetical protein